MSDIATRLRQCAADIRRTPVRLDTWIPLQQEAADTIDALRAEVDAFREDAANYYRIAKEADAQQAALRARVAGYEADIETKVRLIQDLCAMQKEHEDRILAQGARVAEAVRMIEGYKRAGWLTNPAAAEQATDFINRASGNKEGTPK